MRGLTGGDFQVAARYLFAKIERCKTQQTLFYPLQKCLFKCVFCPV